MEAVFFDQLNQLLNDNKLRELRSTLIEMNSADVAEFMTDLPENKLILVFRILPKDLAADVFSYLETETQTSIVSSINDVELGFLVEELYVDDAVDFLEEVPASVVKRVLQSASSERRNIINRFLKYPENSAGSVMTIEMVEFHTRINVKQALKIIRETGVDKETIYTCYVIDDFRHLVGVIPLRRLLLADEETKISDIITDTEHIISVGTLDDQEVVADIARKYDLLSVPVVDNENRLVGIVTIDDIVDIIEDEATEDFEKMALLSPSDEEYLKTGVFTLAKRRILWLMILMVSATFTGKIIENYENMLAAFTMLTACIPMLMDTGGNAGNQTSTLIIRGLALGEIQIKDYFAVLFKEVRVALICGMALAAVNFGRMILLNGAASQNFKMYLVVCAAMLCSVVAAKCIGCSLPMLAKMVHLDPALMAGPMITTIVDALTLIIYFSLATTFLHIA